MVLAGSLFAFAGIEWVLVWVRKILIPFLLLCVFTLFQYKNRYTEIVREEIEDDVIRIRKGIEGKRN